MIALLDTEGTLNAHVPSAPHDDAHQACMFQSDALPEADNSGSAAQEPPKETKQERSVRLKREKNRRNQKAFRERCRVPFQAQAFAFHFLLGAVRQVHTSTILYDFALAHSPRAQQ